MKTLTREEAHVAVRRIGYARIDDSFSATSTAEVDEIFDQRRPAWEEWRKKSEQAAPAPGSFPFSPLHGVPLPSAAAEPVFTAPDPEAFLPKTKRGLDTLSLDQLRAVLEHRRTPASPDATKAQLIDLILPAATE